MCNTAIQTPSHQCGTVRMGDDPATSALNALCRAHDHPNLYVVDAGFFASSAALNPALTIAAQALRVGAHLRDTRAASTTRTNHMNFLLPLTGSFAQPAAENPTVAMIEAAFAHHGLDWRYINVEVAPDDLGDAVRGARAMGWRGFNCSIPHKVAVIDHLDGLGKSAEIIGAVNTIVRDGDRLIGENTDGRGFVAALSEVVDPKGKSVVLFGAGGAARAVAVEMALAGVARITVVNRSAKRGQAVVDLLNDQTPTQAEYAPWTQTFSVPQDTDIVIHATSVGLYPDVEAMPDIDTDSLTPAMVVADGIHNPPLTRLLQAAEARGCQTVDGLGMLVQQGVIGIKYWTGVEADPQVMRQALLDLDL
ncbi:MAG: shikimate dehydrogenase [Rhodobacterales bacterium]